ncbi:MAG: methanogenesis marker 14 protein [Methanocellales archaeon]|nr:methanogenesis marker 14 protein [Methanocellales archaeon]
MKRVEIAKSTFVDASFALKDNVYVVASVELGNTTIKSILTATDLIEGKTYFLDKTVELTTSIRPPKEDEDVFGKTVRGQPLSCEAISEAVKNILIRSMTRARISVNELNFVVRSTGVVAGFETPEEVGEIIKALADGCLKAGIPPRKMVGAMRKVDLLESLQKYSFMDDITFDGAVAGVKCITPIVANEMEGELVLAGIKEGAKWTGVDFRNPCIGIDFGTTLAGRATNGEEPYANVIGSYCGLAGAIFDALAQPVADTALQLRDTPDPDVPESYVEDVMRLIKIKRVTSERRFGTVPVDPKGLKESGIILIGVDVGTNGSKLDNLSKISAEMLEEDRRKIHGLIDNVSSELVKRLIEISWDFGLKGAIGITGRGAITGAKPMMIKDKLGAHDLVFVDDGLARGAAVLARCLHSLGTPNSPLGGIKGGKCVMDMRRR